MITYFVIGFAASFIFDYKNVFMLPVISDYYRPFGSVEIYIGPLLQLTRGLLFGLVLLPFRGFLKEQSLGWLWLWLLFIVFGILGTPAAAPASIEGLIYSKLPIWFHFFGLPEICLQTLIFSFFVHRNLRSKEHPLPKVFQNILHALIITSISFIGYSVISLFFALAAGIPIQQDGTNLIVLGQFIAPIVITFSIVLVSGSRWWLPKHVIMYILSSGSICLYQAFILDSANILYILVAPIIPVLLSVVMTKPKEKEHN
jgi:hypothetical protein